jgi:hypothetical protein
MSPQNPGLRPSTTPAAEAVSTYCFAVHAAADPGVMPRVMELFAKRNLVPSRWHSDLTGFGGGLKGDELVIDIQVTGLTPDESDYIARCLRQQVYVQSVLTSVKEASVKEALPSARSA